MIRKSVMLDPATVRDLDILGAREGRDFSNALRHAVRIGLAALSTPEFTMAEVMDILEARADLDTGAVEELNVADI